MSIIPLSNGIISIESSLKAAIEIGMKDQLERLTDIEVFKSERGIWLTAKTKTSGELIRTPLFLGDAHLCGESHTPEEIRDKLIAEVERAIPILNGTARLAGEP